MQDYQLHENVLSSAKTINEQKQTLALQNERNTAVALRDVQPRVKVTLHYDSTTRSKIDGDWPALILIFSNSCRFPLQPMFFAYEDRKQIAHLIIETYHQLSSALTLHDIPATAKEMWEKSIALKNDLVSRNLKVEELVAEAFDCSNLYVLATVKDQLKFSEKLREINLIVCPFLHGFQTVVETGICSIENLISHDKSASSTKQADLLAYILQRENTVKHIALYKK